MTNYISIVLITINVLFILMNLQYLNEAEKYEKESTHPLLRKRMIDDIYTTAENEVASLTGIYSYFYFLIIL